VAVDYEAQVKALEAATTRHASSHGSGLARLAAETSKLLLAWLHYLRASSPKTEASVLLDGAQAAVIEVVGCLALGLVRPAVFSLRAQADMALSWLYFKDHPVEWRALQLTGEHYQMKTSVWNYLNSYVPRFKERFKLLADDRARQVEDPYKALSAHVHGQGPGTIPVVGDLENLVGTLSKCRECVEAQKDVAEYLNDIFLSCMAQKWPDLPPTIRDQTKKRLSASKLKDLCR
jgi:hypothetical protein